MEQVFETENIKFVKVSESLIDDYLTMINDYENVNRFIGGFIGGADSAYTIEQEIAWVRKAIEENALIFSMLEKKTGEYIGNIELMDAHDSEGELGIAITAKKQDKGYGTEAIKGFVKYCKEKLGAERIFLRTRPYNSRAIHVYEKCGFREYDRTDDHIFMEYDHA